jgi:hypothetical protein
MADDRGTRGERVERVNLDVNNVVASHTGGEDGAGGRQTGEGVERIRIDIIR